MNFDNTDYNYFSRRTVVHSKNGMVATAQPLAAQVGLDILKKGGNAVDAAVATAAALTVVEPTSNGIGGDAFAIVWINNRMHGLNASGHAPEMFSIENMEKRGLKEIPKHGLIPVTVPGAPKAWAELIKRFGNLSLYEVLEPAISFAKYGFPVSPTVSIFWNIAFNYYKENCKDKEFEYWFKVFAPNSVPPKSGEIFKSQQIASTLEEIGDTYGKSFYEGDLADKIDKFSKEHNGFIRKSDLKNFEVKWVEPVSVNYRGYDIWELPPNGHGIVALMALNILKNFDFREKESVDTYHKQIEAVKLAFADGKKYIADINHMNVSVESLLSDSYGKERAKFIKDAAITPEHGSPQKGGTVYLATSDKDGNMVSFIQSNYMGFGSGVVAPNTGIALHNRGHNFNLDKEHVNCVKPNKRPYHTIIPGFITKENKAVGPFGVMGGFMQPQGHVQVVSSMIDFNLNPQDALNAPRWQWKENKKVDVEPEININIIRKLIEKGHNINIETNHKYYGRGQIIVRDGNGVYTGGTEPRADGHIAPY